MVLDYNRLNVKVGMMKVTLHLLLHAHDLGPIYFFKHILWMIFFILDVHYLELFRIAIWFDQAYILLFDRLTS